MVVFKNVWKLDFYNVYSNYFVCMCMYVHVCMQVCLPNFIHPKIPSPGKDATHSRQDSPPQLTTMISETEILLCLYVKMV